MTVLAAAVAGHRARPGLAVLLLVAIAIAWPASRDLVPPSAIPAISAALGRDDPAYRAEGLRFANARHGITAHFDETGLRLDAAGESVGLSLRGLGRGDDVRAVARTRPRAVANRVEYRHGAATEWFVNGPAGLEHGFTLRAPPASGTGPLTVALALTSRPARLEPGRRGLSIGDIRYSGLWAVDARGRELRAWLELDGSRLALRVDDVGARYPLTIDPIFQAGRLSASDAAAGDVFGASVAVSGDTVAVGARGDENGHGAVYVFDEPSTGWATATETAKLTASDGRDGDNLGASVAIAGSTIVAGAPFDTVGDDDDRGSAYVFVRPPGGWADGLQAAKLQVSGGIAQEAFGASVAIDGATVVVGAPEHNVGSDADQGAAYVFVRPPDGWANTVFQTAALTVASGVARDELGRAVAIDDDTVVAGAPGAIIAGGAAGAAFVFERPDAGWSSVPPSARLTAGDAAAADHLGLAVRIAGDTIVAGAPYDDVGDASNVGSAYVFVRPASGWANATHDAKLTAAGAAAFAHVGETLGLAGRTVVAGAAADDVGGRSEQGSMYVYVKPPAGWATAEQTSRLVRGNGLAGEAFGTVAMAGDTIVSGASGMSSSAGAAFVFLDDRVAPETTIASGPSGPTNDNTPTFTFTANEPGSTFRCSVDDGPSTRCESPLEITPALADGHHTFGVVAVDRAGNRDASAAPGDFTVDTSIPDTTITAGPAGPTNVSAPVFEFTSAEPGATFACRVDGGVFTPCTSPFAAPPLGDGPHTFDVHAQDAAGNVDLSDASRAFTVDATAPDTAVTAGPTGATNVSAPTFTFTASEAAAFACRVDSAAFAPCSSPVTTTRLADGPHVFEVVATDAVGNADASAASRGFSVDTVAPDTALASGPRGRITDRNPTFGFTSEPGATFRCRVDRRAFAPCTSRHTTDDLRIGRHAFEVAAVDAAGNADATPASRRIQVLALIASAAFSYETDRAPSGRTVFTKLRLFELDRRATLIVRCERRGCPFARKRVRGRRSSVDLRPLVRNGLRRGTVLTITVTRRGRTAMVMRLKVRAGGDVSFVRRCRAPGARRTQPCAQLRP